MIVVPADLPVTTPFETVAILLFDEDQETSLFVALLGRTVAVSASLAPIAKVV